MSMLAFLRRLWSLVQPYRVRLALGLACGVVAGLMNAVLILSIRLVMNLGWTAPASGSGPPPLDRLPAGMRGLVEHLAAAFPGLRPHLATAALVLAIASLPAAILVRALCGFGNVYLTTWAATRAVVDLRLKLFNHLQNLPLSFFDTARTGELVSRLISDTQVLQRTLSTTGSTLLKSLAVLVALAFLLLSQQTGPTLVALLVVPLCAVPVVFYGRQVRQAAQALQADGADWTHLMHEAFTSNRIVKAYGLEAAVLAQCQAAAGKCLGHILRIVRCGEIPQQLMELLGAVGVALALLYAVQRGQPMSAGELFQFVASVFLMYAPIRSLGQLHSQLEQARAASLRVFALLDTRSNLPEPARPIPLPATAQEIRFDDLSFRYGENPVLQHLNFTVKPGQFVALVGASGSGKSTIVNLLLRFYDPQHGAVRLGGVDIRQVAVGDLRRQIALVTQEPLLFNDTVRQNLAHGRPGASHAEIEQAARRAHAHEFIAQLPRGYDTVVGEKGVALSGGQRQRLAIARALLKDAPILVLDEATNALDAESERVVQAALVESTAGRTTLCIAHRFSTIQNADRIVVLAAGCVAEEGTHAELIGRGGIYQKLYELQSRG